MKTIVRLIRRHVFAAFAIVLLIFLVNLTLVTGVILCQSSRQSAWPAHLAQFAACFVRMPDGRIAPQDEAAARAWLEPYAFAMLLGHDGGVLWQHGLPDALNHPYTVGQVASFTRWYLDDYPVFVWRNDFGLLVAAMPRGSMTRMDFYISNAVLHALLTGFAPLLLLDGALLLLCCLWLSFRAARGLLSIAQGVDALSEERSVSLDTRGMAGELAEKLNRASERLCAQNALIARRDTARTNWIAGVSHDIRTPLALILGYAEQIGAQPDISPALREKAAAIGRQSQVIRTLIEDLNLTSRLQYDAQPLRAAPVRVGPLLRACVTDFINSGQAACCAVALDLPPEAGQAMLQADGALLTRAVTNLLSNSARHNPGGCTVAVRAALADGRLTLTVSDDGAGYPPAVLRCLTGGEAEAGPGAPHILGLHLVRQIVRAHGGRVAFVNLSAKGGACCRMTFDTIPSKHV